MRRRHFIRAVGLFGLLLAVYFLTYHGEQYSTDELYLFDAARSVVKDGTFAMPFANDYFNYTTPPGDQPVIQLGMEPLQIHLAAALIWLAERLPGTGLMQAVWLLNLLVTALTGVVFYYFGVALGYSGRSSLVAALIFGLATIVWPYARMFFREPLLMLSAVTCLYGAEKARQNLDRLLSGAGHWAPRAIHAAGWLAVMGLAYHGATITKDAGLLLLPAMIITLIPRAAGRLDRRLVLLGVLLLCVLIPAVVYVIVARSPEIMGRLNVPDLYERYFKYAADAIPAYLISPGFSIWAFSPALILGWWGAWRLVRQRKIRVCLVPLILTLTFVVAHATIQGPYWYGGLGWGPRFMAPVTPFLALWLLPVAGWLWSRRAKLRWLAAVGVIGLSIALQVIAANVSIKAYPDYLVTEGKRLGRDIIPWQDGVWNPIYTPQFVTVRRFGETPSPIAWVQVAGSEAGPLLCLLVIGLAVFTLVRPPKRILASVGVLAASALMLWGGLRACYRDLRYGGTDDALWRALDTLNSSLRPGDAIILSSRTYRPFFMNYYKGDRPIFVLPNAPGELLNPGETPTVVSDNMEERADPVLQIMLARIALTSQRWWYLTEYNPFMTDRYRVTENYLARHYFPAREVISEPRARLILYAPAGAPPDMVPPWPAHPVNADFGAAVLVGFDTPLPVQPGRLIIPAKPGALLPVSLLWRHDGWPAGLEPFDYSVNLTLSDREGVTKAQRAEPPLGTFGKMSQWVTGGYYRDNHALILPDDLPPGDYTLRVLIFDWRSDSKNLPLRNMDGEGEYVILATIRVE